jgi:hypothetical protein
MGEEQKPYNAADEEQVKGRKEKQKRRDILTQGALKVLMSTPEGRAWLWELLARCGVFRLSFSTDALIMAFNEGKRDIGSHVIGDINRLNGGPELYIRMAVENQGKEKEA